MADPLTIFGVASSAAQFVSLAWQIVSRLESYHSSKSKAPKALLHIQNNLRLMIATCEMAGRHIDLDEAHGAVDETLRAFVTQLFEKLKRLDESTEDLMPNADLNRRRRSSRALLGMWKEKELRALFADLETSNHTLVNYLNVKKGFLSPSASKTLHFFPAANPKVKRKRLLDNIVANLSNESKERPRVVVLHGMGGQGKTSLAVSTCRSESAKYDVILWINASSKQSLRLSFAARVRAMSSGRQSPFDLDTSFEYINNALAGRTWLVVFDNYDAPGLVGPITDYFPTNGNGAIVITSRHRDVRALGTAIDVEGMEEHEAVALLLSRTDHKTEDESVREKAKEIVKLLGYLPLAVDQASAYIGERDLPLENFEQHYQDRMDRILAQTPTGWSCNRDETNTGEVQVQPSVMTTWELSFAHLPVQDMVREHLVKFLSVAAFMAESSISEEIFREFSTSQPKNALSHHWLRVFYRGSDWDNYGYQDLMTNLAKHSLIQKLGTMHNHCTFSFHPMVKRWLQLRIHPSARRKYIKEAAEILATTFSSRLPRESIRISEQLLSYQDALIESSKVFLDRESPFGADDLKEPAIKFAEFYVSRARWGKAAAIWENILVVEQRTRGPADSVIMDIKCQLADVYYHDGKLEAARELLEPISRSKLFKFSPNVVPVLKAMTVLAAICAKKDELREACRLYESAIELGHEYGVHDEIDGVEVLRSLACVYRYLAQHDKAGEIYKKALAEAGSHVSLSTCRTKFGFADLLRNKAQYADAKALYIQAVDGFSELLGPDHPETVGALTNLAIAYRNLEEWQSAEETFWRAITHLEHVLGDTHVDTIRVKMNLAIVYDKRSQTQKAYELYQQVLIGRELRLGLQHAYTLRTVERLTTAMMRLGNHEEAEGLALRTLNGGNKLTDFEKREWAMMPSRLAALERLYMLALQREEGKLGPGHVDWQEAKESLEMVRARQEDKTDAESIRSFYSALDILIVS